MPGHARSSLCTHQFKTFRGYLWHNVFGEAWSCQLCIAKCRRSPLLRDLSLANLLRNTPPCKPVLLCLMLPRCESVQNQFRDTFGACVLIFALRCRRDCGCRFSMLKSQHVMLSDDSLEHVCSDTFDLCLVLGERHPTYARGLVMRPGAIIGTLSTVHG